MSGLFLRNFDMDRLEVAEDGSRMTFSAAEVEDLLGEARATAYAEGYEAGNADGQREAKESLEAQVLEVTEQFRQHFEALVQSEETRWADLERDALELILGMTDRILPDLLDAHAHSLVVDRIRSGLALASKGAQLTIRVSPAVEPVIKAEMRSWKTARADMFDAKIMADPNLTEGAAHLDWQTGYLEYDLDRVCAEIRATLQETLTQLGDAADRRSDHLKKAS